MAGRGVLVRGPAERLAKQVLRVVAQGIVRTPGDLPLSQFVEHGCVEGEQLSDAQDGGIEGGGLGHICPHVFERRH